MTTEPLPPDLVNTVPSDAIVLGHCVVLNDDNEIVYAGPLNKVCKVGGKLVMLNPDDFERFKKYLGKPH